MWTPDVTKTAAAVCGALLLSGCVAPYVAPTHGATAQINFIDNSPSDKMVVHTYDGAAECTDRRNAGFVEPRSQRAVSVPAGRPVVFTVGLDNASLGVRLLASGGLVGALIVSSFYKGCAPTIEFVPEADRKYVFRVAPDGNDCTFQFYAERKASETSDPASSFRSRQWIRPLGEAGPFCKKE